ncbi:hypothetical protein VIGAN_02206700 [Vigna angularis var. angularis]|uniref:Uncharacterized protein n=1 Tax=Vigna angularis var. angularis TaxID=157739 RepID=A0A0S3RF16_PHAAN|nr:hypothetical protein VIGAN_02206700 [Vigna angularis var. angularis]
MEYAMVLLQIRKHLASAAFRHKSVCQSEDSFFLSNPFVFGDSNPPRVPLPESVASSHTSTIASWPRIASPFTRSQPAAASRAGAAYAACPPGVIPVNSIGGRM